MIGKFIVYDFEVFKIKRLNKTSFSTLEGKKIPLKFLSEALVADNKIDAVINAINKIKINLDFAIECAERTGYGSDISYRNIHQARFNRMSELLEIIKSDGERQ